MLHRLKVGPRVAVRALVAAAHVAAGQAQAQVDPRVTGSEAVLAAIRARADLLDVGKVRTIDHRPSVARADITS